MVQGRRDSPSEAASMFIATFTCLMLFNVSVGGVIAYKLYTHLRDRSRREPPQA